MASDFELSWAGGLWDGEGSMAVYPKRNGSLVLHASMHQNHPEVLEKFCRIVGIGRVYGPYGPYPNRPRSPNPGWQWSVGGTSVVPEFFEIIRPYISSVKVEQGIEAIARYRAWKEA